MRSGSQLGSSLYSLWLPYVASDSFPVSLQTAALAWAILKSSCLAELTSSMGWQWGKQDKNEKLSSEILSPEW